MKNRISVALLLFLSLSPILLFAQTGKFYSTDAELSSSLINQMYQDNQGYIWVATEYGLNKFDGNHFTTYKHKENDASSLKNNYTSSLFQDSHSNFYVGCVNGLMIYNKASDSFTEIKMVKNGKTISPNILSFCELKNGDILIATAGYGIYQYKPKSKEAHYNKEICKLLPDSYISYLKLASDNKLWIGTENKGVVAYSFKDKKIESYSFPQLSSNNVSAIIENNEKEIIVGTLNNGINIFDKKKNRFSPINDDSHGNISVKQMTMIGDDVVIGTDGQGIKRYRNSKLSNYLINGAPLDLIDAKVHFVLSDRDNNLWLGIFQKGIVLIPNQDNLFRYWGHKSLASNPIGSGCVMSIYCDSNNDVWVGCDNQGIYQVDRNGKRINHFAPAATSYNVPKTPLCMFEDSKKNFWIGSYASGVALLNRKSGKCSYLEQLKGQKVYCLTEDDNSNIYMATLGSGFYVYNLDSKDIKQYKYFSNKNSKRNQNGVFNDWINYIMYDKDGYLWIAHYSGVSCFDLKTKEFVNNRNIQNIESQGIAYSLLKSKSGDIYIGTSNGLYILKKKSGEVVHLSLDEGLPNEIVCGLEEDSYGNVWMSTYMGISKYVPNQNKFINYYAGDGIQGNEFTHGASCADNQGYLYFGGVNGITSFKATKNEERSADFKVIITGFSIYDNKINSESRSGNKYIISSSVYEAKDFNLSYKDNTFTIDVSTLNYLNPEKIIYWYRIEQMGKKWLSTAPGVNKITFNNLPPGNYNFEVMAEKQGTFSDVKSISIIISPPWYQSWWAYSLYIFLIVFVIRLIIVQYRSKMEHRREIMKREHAEQINEAKLQFFINISHEIRTPMTLIISPLERLIAQVEDVKLKQTYLMIYRNSQRILRLINQLMDIRKIDKGQLFLKFRETDMVGFIDDVKLTFDNKAKQKNIDFVFTHEMDKLNVWVDLNNFDKIMMNLLSNAFKFTPDNGSIEINLTQGYNEQYKGALKSYFEISVTDSGIGLDSDKIDKIFERFYQIDNDVTHSNFGTGIGLHMCKSLIELHHGIIIAQNRTDTNGSKFIIRVPMGSNHLSKSELEMTREEEHVSNNLHYVNEEVDYEENISAEVKAKEKRGRTKVLNTIIIVEDDDEIKNYIKSELDAEFSIVTASDGKEGYEKVLIEKPDLIISDVMMPEMDGISLCKKIKQNNNINQIPIILLTAKSKPEDQIEGIESGADDYIVKPFNIDLLRSKIFSLIESRKFLKNKYIVLQNQFEKVDKIEMKSSDEMLMTRVMNMINKHLDDPELNVEMLATEVGISRVHIHRKLKELTNMSARDFIKTIRLKQAAEMLQNKKLTIAEVAYAVGYTNPSYFSNSFKEQYGMGPKEYMNKYIETN